MESKVKIDTVFGLGVIVFLAVILLFVQGARDKKNKEFAEYQTNMGHLIQMKNKKIKSLSEQLVAQKKEMDTIQNTLITTKTQLDTLSQNLTAVAQTPAEKTK